MSLMKPPHGLAEIKSVFGDIQQYIRSDGSIDPRWETDMLMSIPIPFAIPLAWDKSVRVTKMRLHKLLAPVITETFGAINDRNLAPYVQTYGGGYNFRAKRGVAKHSTHSWGIAFDINTATNQMGTLGDINPELVALFQEFGWKWGGDWSGNNCDPMHFQFCTGY